METMIRRTWRAPVSVAVLLLWALLAISRAEAWQQQGHLPGETTDADADGVADIDDNCPQTSSLTETLRGAVPTEVDACGCSLDPCREDEDRDGVGACLDDCPGTHRGLAVKEDGCPAPLTRTVRVRLDVKFAFDKAEIEPGQEADLLRLRETLLRFPETRVRLEGHTDWKGTGEYNQRLSEARAAACREFILRAGGIDPSRVEAVGFGEQRPVADNTTEDGMARNRRTVAELAFERSIVPANDQPPPLEGLEAETLAAGPP
jgi:OmpA-OmpF porin, OOP family